LEILNKALIERLFEEYGFTRYGLGKLRHSGVSRNVWRKALNGEPVRRTCRVKIAEFLKIDPSTLLLLEREATFEGMVGGKPVVIPHSGDGGKDPLGPDPGRDVRQIANLDGPWHFVTSFEDVGEEEFDVEITSKDQSVTARATCVAGHDKGHISIAEGTFANLILCATWRSDDATRIDSGTVHLMLQGDGSVLIGHITYYHIYDRVLCSTPQIWHRGKVSKKSQTREGETTYRGPAELHELRALDDFGRVQELTNRCYYKIEDATLMIRGTAAHLIIEKVTMYDDPSCSTKRSSHRLEGRGPYVRDSASIQYTVKDHAGRLSWAGVCVLNFPGSGKIHGYWMSAGHRERGRTVLGILELDPLVNSSEEAGGHDQREG
jgi:hypothetical protein